MDSRVVIILINWRRPEEVAKILGELEQQTYQRKSVIIVNNGDRDQLREAMIRVQARAEIIETGKNLGFSGGCNIGIARALDGSADFVWLLNSDTRVPPDCLEKLVSDAEAHPEAGLFSPILYADVPGYPVWVAGGWFEKVFCHCGWFNSEEPAFKAVESSPQSLMVPGTALLARTSALKRIGPFDERLFAYHEDVDLCIRAEVAGIGRRLVKTALYHKHKPGERFPPYKLYYLARNDWLLWRKHAARPGVIRKLWWQFHSLKQCAERFSGDWDHNEAYHRGWWHGLLGFGGEMRSKPAAPGPLYWLTRPNSWTKPKKNSELPSDLGSSSP